MCFTLLHEAVDVYLLKHGNHWRVSLLEEKQHHEGVRVGRQAAARSIPDIAHLGGKDG